MKQSWFYLPLVLKMILRNFSSMLQSNILFSSSSLAIIGSVIRWLTLPLANIRHLSMPDICVEYFINFSLLPRCLRFSAWLVWGACSLSVMTAYWLYAWASSRNEWTAIRILQPLWRTQDNDLHQVRLLLHLPSSSSSLGCSSAPKQDAWFVEHDYFLFA